MDPPIQFCYFDSTYSGIGGPPIPGRCHHASYLSFPSHYIINMSISYRRSADTRELCSSNSFKSSRIGGPPIPGNYGHQIHLNHLVSAGRRYQGTMVIKFIYLILYRRHADTRELWSSNSLTSSRIGGPLIPMEFRDIMLVTYILSADCVSLSTDPIFLGLFRPPLSADRSLLSAGCLCTPFHTTLQTQSSPRTLRHPAARSN